MYEFEGENEDEEEENTRVAQAQKAADDGLEADEDDEDPIVEHPTNNEEFRNTGSVS